MKLKFKLILLAFVLISFVGCSKNNTETKKETIQETKKETMQETKKETMQETKKETMQETKNETIGKEELKGIVTSEQNASVTKTNYYANGNIVTKIEQITDADLSKFDSDTVEIFKANIEPTKQKYSKIKGIEYSVNIENDKLHEVLIMHVNDPEILKNLIDSKLLAIEKGTTQIKLDKILNQFESAGFNVERR
ncbi:MULTISPECIES: DUF1307 domain-containing protein [Helcococcus]|uniref:DUF1307 domain-containing protein n=1 Tax=Helcococcus bovis TaxID=3153252 RepID=A0ABW9F7G3_9FIRM